MKRIIISIASLAIVLVSAAQVRLSLDECRRMALEQSEDLKIAGNEQLQAEYDYKIARNSRLPRLSGSAMGIYMLKDLDMQGMQFSMHGAYSAGLSLQQPIYIGGKITAGIKLAGIGREASAEKIRAARAQALCDADNAYWTYIAVLRQIEMLNSLQTLVDETYSRVEASVEAQLATRADILRVDAKRSEIRYQIERANNGADLCRMNLCNMIGLPLDSEIIPVDTVIIAENPYPMLAQDDGFSVTDRPEYRLLNKQVEASQAKIKLVRADYLPTVAVAAQYSFYGNMKLKGVASDGQGHYFPYTKGIDDNMGMVMLSVNIPIFNWGEGCKKVRQSKLALENSRLQLEKSTRLMTIELQNARHNLTSSYSLIATAEYGEQQAAEALRVMQDRFDVGMATLTDLLDAQSQWQTARTNHIEALTQYKIALTDYLRAAGHLQ